MTRQLVIGAGEVGTALAKVLNCDLRDVAPHQGFYSVIHIAFPWSARFTYNVMAYAGLHEARTVVVHSTVPVGTCDAAGWVHSPVRGRHPDLAESLLAFPKHFGGPKASWVAEQWSKDTDGEYVCHADARTTEAAKLIELATYGAEIAMQKRIKDWCDRNDVDFEQAYTEFGITHNHGWAQMGEPRFIKRLIRDMPGPLGGHCVAQNAWMLGEDWVTDLMGPYMPEDAQ